MIAGSTPPPALRERIARDLVPVRRLRRPWRRTLILVPVALLLLSITFYGPPLRNDAPAVGTGLLWGLSVLQLLYGLALVVFALRASVPGRELAPAAEATLLIVGIGLVVLTTLLTWHASATLVPPQRVWRYWRICFESSAILGLPALLLAWGLAARAFPLRPVMVGALCGLGSGLLADAGWRTFCNVSAPSHVLSSHLAAVLLLCGFGALVGLLRRRPTFRGPRAR